MLTPNIEWLPRLSQTTPVSGDALRGVKVLTLAPAVPLTSDDYLWLEALLGGTGHFY